ncbi:unnamed protein product [Penicillium salamii]|uniref:Uncharacterized protein n=1 Tax=Penicillium salamii TaxID=1612424 RepID=A0A9W4N6W1_9EURO|nr:unnamed protein product [Penicillium salamii]CAG8232399.1 unnamed protein product [Penicillium salamii]CAG8308411.1 unnamed protein product [Penicillium salamii]CAG8643636.1 unnamed protein product [Penicillium salamii]
MGIPRALPNIISQRYSDRLSELFSSGSPEPSNICSPIKSITGSVEVHSDDEVNDTSMDECSDEEDAHEQPTLGSEIAVEHEHQYVEPPNPGYPRDSTSTMIECMAESVEDSLVGQNLWNSEMHRKVVHLMDVIETMRKDMAVLKEQIERLMAGI